MMSNKTYDILSKVQRWLPALGAFYLGLCKVWDLPLGSEINETIVLVATLLATTLEISTVQYQKAQNEMADEENRPMHEMNIGDDVEHWMEDGEG